MSTFHFDCILRSKLVQKIPPVFLHLFLFKFVMLRFLRTFGEIFLLAFILFSTIFVQNK